MGIGSSGILAIAWALAAAGAAGEEHGERLAAITVAGARFSASFRGLDDEGRCVFDTADAALTVPLSELVRWGRFRDVAQGTQIVLDDGSLVVADLLELDERTVAADASVFGRIGLAMPRVRGLLFDPPLAALPRDQLRNQMMAAAEAEDRLLLANGDTVDGVVRQIAPAREGPHAGLATVGFSAAGREFSLLQEDVAAIFFRGGLPERPRAAADRTLVGLRDGTLVAVERLQRVGGSVRLTSAGGAELEADAERFAAAVTLLQPLGSADYVSDLEPIAEDAIPFLRGTWPAARDRNVLGGWLRAGGGVYLKGLGMHTTTRLAYRLVGAVARLDGELAVDDLAGAGGSAVFKVYLFSDGGSWTLAFESPPIRGGQPPLPMSVDLRGTRAMALIAEYSDRGDVLDYANWLDLRLLSDDQHR